MRLSLLFLFLLFSLYAQAEYRAFELAIDNQMTGVSRKVTSTLDHLQYAQYYPVRKDEVVSYVSSWRCFGRTGGFKRICPNPKSDSQAAPKPNSAASATSERSP